jgi:hypothetical protein
MFISGNLSPFTCKWLQHLVGNYEELYYYIINICITLYILLSNFLFNGCCFCLEHEPEIKRKEQGDKGFCPGKQEREGGRGRGGFQKS